jgi:hypothetical protein
MNKKPGISNRASADEEARDRDAHPPLTAKLTPVEDASGNTEVPSDLAREVHRPDATVTRDLQRSSKAGIRSLAQKEGESRHPDHPAPAARKVAGAFGRERPRRRASPTRPRPGGQR